MDVMIFIEKTNRHFSKFMELLRKNSELRLKDVKKAVSRSSYYTIIIKKIFTLNKLLREIDERLFLAEPHFEATADKKIFTALKRCDFIKIEAKEGYFVITCKNEEKSHTNKGNTHSIRAYTE